MENAPSDIGQVAIIVLISVVASVIASVASAARAYPVLRRWFGSFKPVITFGGPVLQPDAAGKLALLLTISVANRGGRPGWVTDLAVRLQGYSSPINAYLFPLYTVDAQKCMELVTQQEDIWKAIQSRFIPLRVQSDEAVQETLVFMHRPVVNGQILTVADLTSDLYTIELRAASSNSVTLGSENLRYEFVGSIKLKVTDELHEWLIAGKAIFALEDAIDEARQRLIEGQ